VILDLAILFFFGFLGGLLFEWLRLPGLIGMLLVGILLGPHGFDLFSDALMGISYDLRLIALVVILLRAGLGLNKRQLQAVGKTAVFLAIIPNLLEGFTVALLAMWLLGFTFLEAGILGFIIAAVSPAVVVPAMIRFMDKRLGMNKKVPVLILSSASLDDVFAITFFSAFLGVYLGTHENIGLQLLNIPLAIAIGVLLGIALGFILVWFFNKVHMRDSKKVVLILAVSFFMVALEHSLQEIVMIASLLGVMAMGIAIVERKAVLGPRLSNKFTKIWVMAEIFLFVLVGAEVDVGVAIQAGLVGLALIAGGLLLRSVGVILATMKSPLDRNERLFTVMSYWPKATVQAAIGAIPLSLGVRNGDIMLAIAILSVLVTAPLGAIMIETFGKRLLHVDSPKET